MALFAHWSSKTRRGHIAALSPVAGEPVGAEEAEALFVAWEASTDKSAFITGVSLVQASALCDLIARRVPPTYHQDGPLSNGTLHRRQLACKARIAELLGGTHQARVSDVYAVLRSDYGACPVPRLITADMVAEALARLGGKAGQ